MSKQEPFVLEFEADVDNLGEPGKKDRWRIVVKGTTIQVERWSDPDAMGTKHWASFRGDGWNDAAILRYAVTALVRGVAARSFVDTSTEMTEAYIDAMDTIEIPDMDTAREYLGRAVLLGHRDDGCTACWAPVGGDLRVEGVRLWAGSSSRSIHDGVVIKVLDGFDAPDGPPTLQRSRGPSETPSKQAEKRIGDGS